MPGPMKLQARLTAITPFSEDVFKLDFAVERKYTRFKPGQFLHLTLDNFDPTEAYWPESRVFSICSAPRSSILSIIFSIKGSYTERMRNELIEGREYWLKMPYGDFIIEHLVPQDAVAVLIAGGTGISPYVSFIEQGLEKGFQREVYLAYAVRSPDRLAFESVLRDATASESITTRIWSEDAADGSDLITDRGRLDLDAIVSDVAVFADPRYLLSGPPAMLSSFCKSLEETHNVDPTKIHIDEWE